MNEVHVSLPCVPPRGLVLQIGALAGGATPDYTQHIKECIEDVTDSFAKGFKQDKLQLQQMIIGHLKNTLTDLVAVNHCVVEQLKKDFDTCILELNCNVAPT